MAAKLFSLYLLAVAGLEVVRAGTFAYSDIPCSFADVICKIAPLILDQRGEAQCNVSVQDNSAGLQNMSVMLSELAAQMAYVPIVLPLLSRTK